MLGTIRDDYGSKPAIAPRPELTERGLFELWLRRPEYLRTPKLGPIRYFVDKLGITPNVGPTTAGMTLR